MSATRTTKNDPIRRFATFLAVACSAAVLAGCTTTSSKSVATLSAPVDALQAQAYAAPINEPYRVDAVDVGKMDPRYLRQVVEFPTNEPVGTVVVDPHQNFSTLSRSMARRFDTAWGSARLALNSQELRPLSTRKVASLDAHE